MLGKMLGNLQFLKLKHQVTIFSNTWCSNGANEVVIYNFFGSLDDWYKYQSIYYFKFNITFINIQEF